MVLRSYTKSVLATALHGGSSSLFVGFNNGDIEEWNAVGRCNAYRRDTPSGCTVCWSMQDTCGVLQETVWLECGAYTQETV